MDIDQILDGLADAKGVKVRLASGYYVIWNAADAVFRIADRRGDNVYFSTARKRDDKQTAEGVGSKDDFVERILMPIAKLRGLGWSEQPQRDRRDKDTVVYRLV